MSGQGRSRGKERTTMLESRNVNIEGPMFGKLTDTLSIPAIPINYVLELFLFSNCASDAIPPRFQTFSYYYVRRKDPRRCLRYVNPESPTATHY